MMTALIPTLTAVGLFFCGAWLLAENLSHVASGSARKLFRRALGSNWRAMLSGVLSGLLTQSTNAIALIAVSFVRSGIVEAKRAPLVPAWAHVGASALVFLAAQDTKVVVAWVLAICGTCLYFELRISDQWRHAVLALVGTGILLLGLDMLHMDSEALQEFLVSFNVLNAESHPLATLGIGIVLATLTQSSTVTGAIGVALVGAGVITFDTGLLLLLGANVGSGLNYAFIAREGEATHRHIHFFQGVQKLTGSLLMLVPILLYPKEFAVLIGKVPTDLAHQLALAFLMIQVVGSSLCTLANGPLSRFLVWMAPPRHEDELAKPAYLIDEALNDSFLALELAERENHRLLQRLPLMLERLRADGDARALAPGVYCSAGLAVGAAVRRYLASILDRQPDHAAIARTMSLQQGVTNSMTLHETLAEFVHVAVTASAVPAAQATVSRMIEALHMLLGLLAEAASSGDIEDHNMALSLFGQRDDLMDSIRKRLLASDPATPAKVQEALFQTTILFERILWLARDSLLALMRERGEAAVRSEG